MHVKQLILIVLASATLLSCSGESQPTNKADNKNSASTTKAFIAPAEIVSLQRITVGPPNVRSMWNFKIEYIAHENVQVKKGDVLLRFDGQRLRTDLVGRQSNLDAAIKEREKAILRDEATLQSLILDVADAKKDRDIAQRKVEITDISRSEIERLKQKAEFDIATIELAQAEQKLAQHRKVTKINREVDDAKVANAEARVKEIENSLARLNVSAPADGLVSLITDWDGNKPTVGETVWMGRSLIDLPSLDKLAVKVEIDEADSSKVKTGQSVRVILDDHPERAFSGNIVELGKTFRVKSQQNLKVVIDAWVTLDTIDKTIMRPGMKANVEII